MKALHSQSRNFFVAFRQRLAIGSLCCLINLCTNLYGAEQEATEQELAAVNEAIEEIGDWLDAASSRQSAAQQALRDAELAVSNLNQSITLLASNLRAADQRLQSLQQQQFSLRAERDASREVVEQLIRAAYVTGESGFLKTLLNQENSSEATRMLAYSRIFSEYQLKEIEQYQSNIDELEAVAVEISLEQADIAAEQRRLNTERDQLQGVIQQRESAFAALQNEIADRSMELEQLEIDQAELQTLREEIARAMSGIRSFADVPPLDDARGQLPRPLAGPVLNRFGSSYGAGGLTRQGILIGAEEGTPITAVHPGYVAFASWLQGQGLLVVLDHGEGFVTLYGGNQALAVEAGEWVARDQVIATSGKSPSNNSPGLYFELRREGEAQNPSQWLSSP